MSSNIDTADHVLHRPSKYQPRYRAYAYAHRRTPDAMLAFDKLRYPGGHMAEYMVWIGRQLRAWSKIQHPDFDRWLSDRYRIGIGYYNAMLAERARMEAEQAAQRGRE